jgi:hypothetical protein
MERICEAFGLESSTVEALLPLVRKTSSWSLPVKLTDHTGMVEVNLNETVEKEVVSGGGGEAEDKTSESGQASLDPSNPTWESPLEAAEREERLESVHVN